MPSMRWNTHTSRQARSQHGQETSRVGRILTSSTEGPPGATSKHYHQHLPEAPLEGAQTATGRGLERKATGRHGITVITVHRPVIEATAAPLLAHTILEALRDARPGEMIEDHRQGTKGVPPLHIRSPVGALHQAVIPTFPAMMTTDATIDAQESVTSHLEEMTGAHETIAETDMAIATATVNTSIRIDLRWIEFAAARGGLAVAAAVRRERSIRATTGPVIVWRESTTDDERRDSPRHYARCRQGEYTRERRRTLAS